MQLNEKKPGAEISVRLLPSLTLNLVNLLSRVLLLERGSLRFVPVSFSFPSSLSLLYCSFLIPGLDIEILSGRFLAFKQARERERERKGETRDSLAQRTVKRMEATEFRSFLIKIYESCSSSLSEAYR